MPGGLCDFAEDMYCGDIEEGAGREQHGYTSEGQLDDVHHLQG